MKYLTALASCLVLAGLSYADPISPTNDRPETIAAAQNGDSVQDMLDDHFGVDEFDAGTDQDAAGYFRVATPGSTTIAPQLVVQNDDELSIGIFSLPNLDDDNTITRVTLFSSDDNADDGWSANIKWTDDDTIKVTIFDDNGDIVVVDGNNSNSYDGIERFGFGFFAEDEDDNIFYSLDELNEDEEARVLSYNDGLNNEWGFFFESDADDVNDFNESCVFVE